MTCIILIIFALLCVLMLHINLLFPRFVQEKTCKNRKICSKCKYPCEFAAANCPECGSESFLDSSLPTFKVLIIYAIPRHALVQIGSVIFSLLIIAKCLFPEGLLLSERHYYSHPYWGTLLEIDVEKRYIDFPMFIEVVRYSNVVDIKMFTDAGVVKLDNVLERDRLELSEYSLSEICKNTEELRNSDDEMIFDNALEIKSFFIFLEERMLLYSGDGATTAVLPYKIDAGLRYKLFHTNEFKFIKFGSIYKYIAIIPILIFYCVLRHRLGRGKGKGKGGGVEKGSGVILD